MSHNFPKNCFVEDLRVQHVCAKKLQELVFPLCGPAAGKKAEASELVTEVLQPVELLLGSFAPPSVFESFLKSIDRSLEFMRLEVFLVLQQIQNAAPSI